MKVYHSLISKLSEKKRFRERMMEVLSTPKKPLKDKVERFMLKMEPHNQLEMDNCVVVGHQETKISFLSARQSHLVIGSSQFVKLSKVIYSSQSKNCTIKIKKNYFSFNGKHMLFFEGKCNFLIVAYNKVRGESRLIARSRRTIRTD